VDDTAPMASQRSIPWLRLLHLTLIVARRGGGLPFFEKNKPSEENFGGFLFGRLN
jgi:hypothetical protein